MKLTFKDLKQQKFIIDAEPSETIGQVKEKISQEKGWEAGQQKLIYSGKILQDEKTVESYNIEEKGFIVCMTSKPKAAPTASASTSKAPSTPAPAPASTPAAPTAPAPASNTTSNPPATPSPAPAATGADPANFNDPSNLALGSQRDEAIRNMEGMGFPRAEIDRAMRAAFFNPDRAVEYLLN
ncbi:UV excision repair protein rad23, partial [Lecanora helva]